MADVRIQDNSGEVRRRMRHAKQAALIAMALAGKELIQEEIMSGYGDPIKDTGTLHDSFKYDQPQNDEIHVGTSVQYANFVHDGTYKMIARPFVKTALQGNEEELLEVGAQVLQKQMK